MVMDTTCSPMTERYLLSTYRHVLELFILISMSVFGAKSVLKLFKKYKGEFLRAGFAGVDMNKPTKPTIPEAQGVICGVVFLSIMFLFIPVPFWRFLVRKAETQSNEICSSDKIREGQEAFFKSQFIQYLAGLLSVCCMLFLGFADDALNLPWRHKIGFPFVAGLPLLMVYLANEGTTRIAVPVMFRGSLGGSVDIGVLYYIYMGLLTVFCTNSINIYAGINGLEVGQAIVIGASLILFNLIELMGYHWRVHLFSLYFLIPFLAVCWSLYRVNRYPAKVFVGDTFCYFAGMTFAVVGILGHFSKTLLLFFLPQIINFLYSTPQLFGLIPCPRHRLPRYDSTDGLLHPSRVRFHPKSLSRAGQLVLSVFSHLGIIECKLCPDCIPNIPAALKTENVAPQAGHENMSSDEEQISERQRARSRSPVHAKLPTEEIVEVDNLTVINMMLRVLGPKNEQQTTNTLLLLQVFCSCLAFMIRYPLAWFFFDVPAN
uniref:UDP-N-acetylglucosamine--dolichyl-phosphate N-acetylglucosaminephosphotransferase n=1 Tax=Schistosoma japonicum TaxID=6182 RepID=Q5DC78_SCHJA|nr:SJCHGC01805 protein [Schistosoma japonicum]CAX70363.1 putative dolichyl-phosphate (UDP-N-acetylglucosamine) N-acetylglucosaminephosphotransferase 1 (GlcNAc-1-P transferase) [Schistosoma japonicum]CAX75018.1 putative dolichyl-phosphate (UDP-N-acetylglucosamine) N-acetylglucosaminephosphotransferase 1 (GlcNAc-1-P transferase) [Schistosoma japonicum]